MYVVYQLVNSKNQIEYVGHTKNPNTRLHNHICINGKFTGRKDLSLEIVKSGFSTKLKALDYEHKLQKKLWFESDREKNIRIMKQIREKGTECRKVKIVGYDLLGNEIGRFSSILEASQKLKIHTSLIWNVVNGHQKSTKNFVFRPLENV